MIGKGQALKMFQDLKPHAEVFYDENSSKEQIAIAAEKAMICLYNGSSEDDLGSLRHKRFFEKLTTISSYVQPNSLPLTSSATKFHSFRVFLQILE